MTVETIKLKFIQSFHGWEGKHNFWETIQKLGYQNVIFGMGFSTYTPKRKFSA